MNTNGQVGNVIPHARAAAARRETADLEIEGSASTQIDVDA